MSNQGKERKEGKPQSLAQGARAAAGGAMLPVEADAPVEFDAPIALIAPALAPRRLSPAARLTALALLPATIGALAFSVLASHGAGALVLALAGVMLSALTMLFVMLQARALLRPLRAITAHCERIAARYQGEPPPRARDELVALARAHDAMAGAMFRNAEGARQKYLAEAQNSLDLQREYALMQMLRNLACVANDGESLERALQDCLREIGGYLDWPVGRLVWVERAADGRIERLRSHWYVPDAARFPAFLAASDDAQIGADARELIGRAQQSKLSHWFSDLGRLDDWPRREQALACGLRTGFVIPITTGEDTGAFVEFFSDHRIEASAEMLELVEAISVELWRTASRCPVEVSARRAMSLRERQLLAIVEGMEGAVAVVDGHGRVEWVNAALTRLVGCNAAQAVGCDLPELLFGTDPVSAGECRRYLQSTERVTACVLTARSGEAEPRWFELEIEPMPGEGNMPSGRFVIVRDITRDRATHLALIEALEVAKQASQSKSQFLANMSHEIRTPMNGVLGMAELLMGTELDERQRRYTESLSRSGEALLDIINDILDFSKIEAGKLELETIDFDLRALVEDLVELLAPRAHQKRIELAFAMSADVPVLVRGDPTRLRQVLVNVIGNAIKFTERGEVVLRVEAAAADTGGDRPDARPICFVVRDTGIGMRPEVVDRLFSVFMQADQSSSRRHGGTGLGLAICRQLVELMGGQIRASSRIGEGSVFEFEVPLQPAQPGGAVAATALADAATLAGKRVLIVEDNPTNRSILLEQMRSFAMDCGVAENGRQALQMLRIAADSQSPFDVAVVDMKMPVMNGLLLAEAIRADASLQLLPIVMLTSIAGRDDARRAQALGIEVYLSKPVRRQELISGLATALQVRSAEPAEAADQETFVALAGCRVLVVEDNPVNQEVVGAMLAGFACKAQLAENGLQALEMLERESFDVVLMDCQMPTMDGFEAMRRLRDPLYRQHDLERARAVPVIALTANALRGDDERCRAAGFSEHLAKPFRQRDLGKILLRWCSDPGVRTDRGASVPGAVLDPGIIQGIVAMERNGAKDLLQRLIATYESSSAAMAQQADLGFAQGDAAAIDHALHTLESSSANIGALQFAQACATVHALVRAGRLREAGEDWSRLRDQRQQLVTALRQYRPQAPTVPAGSADLAEAQA